MKLRILAACAALTVGACAAPKPTAKPAAKPTAKKPVPQKITINLPAGYKDAAATVKAGQPVAITFKLTEEAGCGNTISVPEAKWKKDLKVGQSATVTYTPKKSGKLNFACGMDMMKGTVTVK